MQRTVAQLDIGSANFDLLCGALMAFGEKLMLTYERVNELLRYDTETGKLYWKVRPAQHVHIGDEAGGLLPQTTNTYRRVRIDGWKYYTHRIVWLLNYKVWPDGDIDHIDGNGLNNRIENLRDVPSQENQKNMRMYRTNKSGVTGVYWNKATGKWQVMIGVNGKQKHLGYFTDFDEAASAYRKAADALGFTKRHGTT